LGQQQQQQRLSMLSHSSEDAVMDLSSELEDNVALAFRQLETQMDSALGAISSTVPRALASTSPEVRGCRIWSQSGLSVSQSLSHDGSVSSTIAHGTQVAPLGRPSWMSMLLDTHVTKSAFPKVVKALLSTEL
jgi:hypothetical protein